MNEITCPCPFIEALVNSWRTSLRLYRCSPRTLL